jgi:hypothetical protein
MLAAAIYSDTSTLHSHDYIGRSTAKGSFMIWTHHMKNITFDETFTLFGSHPSVVYDNSMYTVIRCSDNRR